MKRILFLISEGVFDAFGNCSDSAYITAFSTIRKSVLYLCVTGNCQDLCIISKCKDGIQSNERNSQFFPSKYFGILLKWSSFIFVVVIASFSVLFLLSHSLEHSYYRSLVEKQAFYVNYDIVFKTTFLTKSCYLFIQLVYILVSATFLIGILKTDKK